MRRALILAAFAALAAARPELYKEKEDFQFSRSSSDDGTKSGFYGAQRGNMGGNYERAHNMDLLAQHHMGGLVKNVEGELGDGLNQKSGSVYTAANSRGVYGSGRYDLSNLQGRNFQEGTSFGTSQSQSSLSSHNTDYSSQAYLANAAYGGNSHNSRYNGYRATGTSDQALYNTQQSADNLQSASQYDATQAAQNSGYYSQSGLQENSAYDQAAVNSHLSNAYGSNIRFLSAQPVRVYVRPGGRVAVPIAAQSLDSSRVSATAFDQNAITSEAEVLNSNTQQAAYKPTSNAKHYESSFSYKKEWEKHDSQAIPGVAVPTANPLNSELNEDTQTRGLEHKHEAEDQHAQSGQSSHYNRYNIRSGTSSQSRHQSEYNAQQNSAATQQRSSAGGSNAYTYGANNKDVSASLNTGNLNNQVEDIGSKPKSYQSSYSYHKSWERQGDPYVIIPSTNGLNNIAQESQRLSASSLNREYGSRQQNSHYHQGYVNNNGIDCDCDENGHIRVARSNGLDHNQVPYQQNEDIYEGQQSQNLDFGQQSQNLEDFGQETQNLENLGQQSQNLESLDQQTQQLEDFGQQSQNLENLGQESQNLENLGQESQNFENLGQETQQLEQFGQHSQKLEDFDQQSLNQEQDDGQQAQNTWDQQSQNLGQETQNTWHTQETKQTIATETEQNRMEHTYHSHQDANTLFLTQIPRDYNFKETSKENNLKPMSQTTEESSSNPNVHILVTQHQQVEETPYETELTGSQYTGHQTQYNNWNSFQSPHHMDHHHRFHQHLPDIPDWQKIGYGYGPNHHNHFPGDTGNIRPWIRNPPINIPYNQFQQHSHGSYGSSLNAYTNSQTYASHTDDSSHSYTNIELPAHESGKINNLWDMIDNIEKHTTTGDGESEQDFKPNNYLDPVQNLDKNSYNEEGKQVQPVSFSPSTTEHPKIDMTTKNQNIQRTEEIERGDIEPEKNLNPQEDVGRGDIGPNESSSRNSENALVKPIIQSKPTPLYVKPKDEQKFPKENKPSYSDNKLNNYGNSDLSVLSLNEHKNVENKTEQNHWQLDVFNHRSTTTEKNSYLHPTVNQEQNPINIEQQNSDQQSVYSKQQVDNQNQESYNPSEVYQQNMNQEIIDIGQENENLGQQGENFYQQNLNKQTTEQHKFDVEQGPKEIEYQNLDQQFVNENLNQHNLNQFENLGQQGETGEQVHYQSESSEQESQGFHQENINDFGQHEQESLPTFDQQQNNINHKQKEQQLEDRGQQNENLELNNQAEDLNPQVQNSWQSSDDLVKQMSKQVERQLAIWHQQNKNLEQNSQIEDQQNKELLQQNQNSESNASPSVQQNIHEDKVPFYKEPVVEQEIVTQKNTPIELPPEPVTEKIGFWNKVGSKLVGAKDKVASWFSRS